MVSAAIKWGTNQITDVKCLIHSMSLPHKPHTNWKVGGIRSRSSSGPQSHLLSCDSLSPLLGLLSLLMGFLSPPAGTSPSGHSYPGPFSCRVRCQLTQSLEFQHSSHHERSTSEPHQRANAGQLLSWLSLGQVSNPLDSPVVKMSLGVQRLRIHLPVQGL